MDDRPDVALFGIAFVFGTIVPVGSFYLLTAPPVGGSIGDAVLLVWIALLVLATVVLDARWRLPPDALLGGGILGTIVGFGAFAALIGWSVVMFAAVPIAGLAIVLGAWLAYERDQRHDEPDEPPYGSWRHVFAMLAALTIALLAALLVV